MVDERSSAPGTSAPRTDGRPESTVDPNPSQLLSPADKAVVGAVVLNYKNCAGALLVCDRLLAQTRLPDWILLLDNNSGENELQELRRTLPSGVELIALPDNDGYGAGMNAGIEECLRRGADQVLLLTHDCVLPVDAVARLSATLQERTSAGVVGPVLIRTRNASVWSCGGRLRPLTKRGAHVTTVPDEVTKVDWLDGAALLYRAAALRRAGLFGETFFLYEEDVEHHLRLADSGFEVLVEPRVQVMQDSLEVPPYLAVRNHLLLCSQRGWAGAAWFTGAHAVLKAASARRRWWQLPVVLRAVRDARSGSLDRERALRR